jgi:hypothetical protein
MSQHTDHVTGQPIEGKAYVIQSTEGPEIVAPETLLNITDLTAAVEAMAEDVLGVLTARVEELEERVRDLTADKSSEGDVTETPAASTSTRKAAAK